MKKSIIFLSLSLLLSITGYSQIMMDAASGTVTATYDVAVPIKTIGSIIIQPSSTYNGTTDTLKLYVGTLGRNNVIIWTPAVQDDLSTPVKFVVTSAHNATPLQIWIESALYNYYRLSYIKGDCTAGTITAILSTKQN